jgi:predicted phosphoribosyltransferase
MFRDRKEAGERLAEALAGRRYDQPVVLALPRGGVPVAAPVAARLKAPLDLLMVRKIGVPGQEELAAGAVAEGQEPEFNADLLAQIGRRPEDFTAAVNAKRAEMAERRVRYCGSRAPVPLHGRTAIVVDDGIATGATMRASLRAARAAGAARVILAVPVAPEETLTEFAALADDIVCLETPRAFYAVGAHYRDFSQVRDDELQAILAAEAGG